MMPERVPDLWQRQFGQLAVIEQAKALIGLGGFKEAKALLERIVKEGKTLPAPAEVEWGSLTTFHAERLLLRIIAESDLPATVEKLIRAAKMTMSSHKWAEAEALFLAAAAACATEEEIRECAIPAWMDIAQCRYRDNRFKEAYEAFDHLLRNFKTLDADRAGDVAYFRYRAAAALFAKTRHADHKALKLNARWSFVRTYPDHPRASDTRYYEGVDLVSKGDALQKDGLREQALAAYARSAEYFTTMKPSSILYAKARARIVEVNYRTGAHDEAVRAMAEILAYLADPKNLTTDPLRKPNRQSASALATYYGAGSLGKLRRWQEVLDLLADYEKKYSSEELTISHDGIKLMRAHAQRALDSNAKEEDGPSDD